MCSDTPLPSTTAFQSINLMKLSYVKCNKEIKKYTAWKLENNVTFISMDRRLLSHY